MSGLMRKEMYSTDLAVLPFQANVHLISSVVSLFQLLLALLDNQRSNRPLVMANGVTELVAAAHDAVKEEVEAAEEDGDRSNNQYPIKRGCAFHSFVFLY